MLEHCGSRGRGNLGSSGSMEGVGGGGGGGGRRGGGRRGCGG